MQQNSITPTFTDLDDIPGWVKWIAQDGDGAWWGYSVEPLRYDSGWYENEVGRHILLGISKSAWNWENSLQQVNLKLSIAIRAAGLSDLPAINQVIESAIRSWDLSERVKNLSLSIYQYDEQDLSHMHMFVAENSQQEIIGMYALDEAAPVELTAKETVLLLHGIYVNSDSLRQGIGQALFMHAENQLRKMAKTELLVKSQPGAVGFFKAQGMIKFPLRNSDRDYPYLYWKRLEADGK